MTSPNGKRVLAVVTDAFGGYGGIAAYSRDVLTALCEDDRISEVVTIPRVMHQEAGPLPSKLHFQERAATSAGAFVRAVLREGLKGGKWDMIYCAHVNHVPLVWLIAKLTRTPWVLCLYGYEVWAPTGRKLVDRLVGKADHYIPLSQLTLDRFLKVWSVEPGRCTVMHNALHDEQFGPWHEESGAACALLPGRQGYPDDVRPA